MIMRDRSYVDLCYYFNKGRVIGMGRYEYIKPDGSRPGVAQFISNAVMWLAKLDPLDTTAPIVGTHMNENVGSFTTLKKIQPADIATNNIQVIFLFTKIYRKIKSTLVISLPVIKKNEVYFVSEKAAFTDSEIDILHDFVESGGGLMVGGQAWSWKQKSFSNSVQFANGYPINK